MPPAAKPDAALEAQLRDDVAGFIHDPLGFVLWAFDWGHGVLEGETGPDTWQVEYLTRLGKLCREGNGATIRMAVASGHGVGKSTTVAWVILWAMATRPDLAAVVTANTGTQLSGKTWRELALWHQRCIVAHWFTWTATAFTAVESPMTWKVNAVTWSADNPEAFAGLHGAFVLVIFDEASAIDDIIWEVTEGALTTLNCIWLAFGNPTRNTGRFVDCWKRFRARWETFEVDSRTSQVAKNKAQIQEWIEDYGLDSDFVRIRVLGKFPRVASMQLIGPDLVEQAQRAEPTFEPLDPLLVGADIAREGKNETVICFRRGRDARTWRWLRFQGRDTVQVASVLARISQGSEYTSGQVPDAILLDGGGIGGGVIDQLKRLGIPHVPVLGQWPAGDPQYQNIRTESWVRMKEWLERGGAIPSTKELAGDLVGPEYGYIGKSDKLLLESKDAMARRNLPSPDHGDALALTFAFPVGPRRHGSAGAARAQRREESILAWDPHAEL